MNRKGMGIGNIYPVVLIVALATILLAVILFTFLQFQEGIAITGTGVTNETLSTVSESGVSVAKASDCGFNSFAVSFAANATSGVEIASTNYTVNADTGTVTATDGAAYNGTNWNVTYTYEYGREGCDALEDITTDFVDFVPWIGVILLVIAAAIVLGIVVKSFVSKRRGM